MPTSHNVRILHAVPMFRAFDPEASILTERYTYFAEDTELESIWRWNNVVDGSELPIRHHTRSLSIGDVVGIRKFEGWSYHEVMTLGFADLDSAEVDRALERGEAWDPFEGL